MPFSLHLHIMHFVTAFADEALLLPLAASVVFGFATSGWRRGAAGWGGAVALTLAVMLGLKLALIPCGHLLLPGLRSPSGHTAAAAAIYGSLIGIWTRHRGRSSLWTAPVALGVAVVIAVSRLALHVHSPIEVLVGGGVGITGAMLAVVLAGPPPAGLRLRSIAVAMVVVIVVFHGFQLPAEAEIRRLSFTIWPFSACR
ncbi:MAG: phosphatase PAP2 family protein [Proteobacteria bacterium]|nr:phosphatase PAP2 family protein [Pseudomonadota bacterium]